MKGYTQVYTGNGKGKTTAALGLTIRALGAGKKVLFVQFMKALGYSEHNLLDNLSMNLTWKTMGKPFFIAKEGDISEEDLEKYKGKCVVFEKGNPPEDYVAMIREAFEEVKEQVWHGGFDVVILDEINCAVLFELLPEKDLLELVNSKPDSVELILTGRGATEKVMKAADLVTEMREIKHYYTQGVEARKGIEN